MELDLFTLAAQLVNFIILIFLLNKFLFKRVQAAMTAREKHISDNLSAAERIKKEAIETAAKTEAAYRYIKDHRQELITKAISDAEETKKRLEAEISNEAEAARMKWQEDLINLKDYFIHELRLKSGDFVCRLAEKALLDLADEDLNTRVIQVFTNRVRDYDSVKAKEFSDRIQKTEQNLLIKSAFAIPEDLKKKVIQAIKEKFSYDRTVFFELSLESFCGISLLIEDYKISWSVEDYLSGLEEELAAAFEAGKKIETLTEGNQNE